MRSIGDRKGCKGWVSHSLAFVATMLVAGLQFLFSPAWAGYELPPGERITNLPHIPRSMPNKESYESYDPVIGRSAEEALENTIAVLGARETSTGECVRRAGNEMLFQQLAATLIATFTEFGIRRIVTCDPHAYNTLKNEYPDFHEWSRDWRHVQQGC